MYREKYGELHGELTRPRILPAYLSLLYLALVVSPMHSVQAAELQVLAGGAMMAPMKEIATVRSCHRPQARFSLRYYSRTD